MTTINHTPHYAAKQQAAEDNERARLAIRRFDDFKTLLLAMVVAAPIATVVGMVIDDWFMIGLALFITCSCGLTALYLLKRLENTIFGR